MADMIAKVGSDVTVGQELLTPDVKNLFDQIKDSGVDHVNFTSFDIVVSFAEQTQQGIMKLYFNL
jgi:hypothetical protein